MLKAGVEKAVPASEIEKIDRKVDLMEEVRELRSQVLEEAWRTLSPGGILIWQGAKEFDLEAALKIGFTILQSEKETSVRVGHYNLIFTKELKDSE